MKCPKCGYNSFEFLDNCKKCSHDLSAFKQTHGIRAVVLPLAGLTVAAPAVAVAAPSAANAANAEESFTWDVPAAPESFKPGDDIFSDLDLGLSPSPAPAEPASAGLDLGDFSFDDTPAAPAVPAPSTTDADAGTDDFATLLETGDNSEITAAAPGAAQVPEMESPWEVPTDSFGGFGDTPAPAAEPAAAGDFDLESFSWDDKETKTATTPAAPKGPEAGVESFPGTDFDSLFGDAGEEEKK